MKAQISFAEIEEIIRKKANKNVGFSYVSSDTVRVSTTYEKDTFLTKVNISLNVDVKLIKIDGSDIILEYSIGEIANKLAGLNVFGNVVDKFIQGSKYKDLISFDPTNRMRLTVHLGSNEKTAKTMEVIEIIDLKFEDNGAICEIKVK